MREAAAALAENVGIAYGLIERPEVWRAVQSAAESFAYGRNDGRKTAKIILEALGPRSAIFAANSFNRSRAGHLADGFLGSDQGCPAVKDRIDLDQAIYFGR